MKWHEPLLTAVFREGGRTLPHVDCYGLHRAILMTVAGIEDVPEWGEGYSVADARRVGALFEEGAARRPWIAVTEEREFDAILLRRRGRLPLHVGTVVRPGIMLHITSQHSPRLEDYRSPEWRSRVLGFFRHEALA
ncbi:hypothetical protein DYI37_03075 [Fulvimarina endophytica]|uniref:NlpC/P60 domain-containing protein n=1 Tax=Fulvimarina endophytica TaxID=2293836 RepID=A0A371XB52_9HYPH|nr:hypothetical protein [Fulvimarina endophytica]RFC66440.1 hypothetical protein DYI37_03075 [Fulvimarina endophytica]